MKNATEAAGSQHDLIDQLLVVSKSLLSAAQAEDWEDVDTLNQQRNELLLDLTEAEPLDRSSIDETVRNILELDSQLLALTNSAMNTVADKVGAMAVKTKISLEYRSVQSIT